MGEFEKQDRDDQHEETREVVVDLHRLFHPDRARDYAECEDPQGIGEYRERYGQRE